MQDWIDVKYAVPPDCRKVLIVSHMTDTEYPPEILIGWREVFKKGKIKWKVLNEYGTSIICVEGTKSFRTITYWMPLPELPK